MGLLVVCSGLQLQAEQIMDQPTFRFMRTYRDDGLPNNFIYDITQDTTGFLWIVTTNGVARYDGNQFKIFVHDSSDPGSLSDNWVNSIYVDRQGALWLATKTGLDRLNPDGESFSHFIHDPENSKSISDSWASCLLEDSHGELWVGTHTGLNRMDREQSAFTRIDPEEADLGSLRDERILVLVEDGEERLWVGTASGLFLYDRENDLFVRPHQLPAEMEDAYFTTALVDSRGDLWLGISEKGLLRLPFGSNRFEHMRHDSSDPDSLSSNEVWDLSEDTDGRIWIGLWDKGINVLDLTTGEMKKLLHSRQPDSIPSNYVGCLYRDRSGLMWVGTTDGLGMFNPRSQYVDYIGTESGERWLSDSHVWSFWEDALGGVWVGTDDGLNYVDPDDSRIHHYLVDPEDQTAIGVGAIWAIVPAEGGSKLWLSGEWGLDLFEPSTGSARRFRHDPDDPSSLIAGEIYTVAPGRDGNIWVAGSAAILAELNPHQGTIGTYLGTEHMADSDYITSLAVAGDETIWVGSTAGVWHVDPETGEQAHYSSESGQLTVSVVNSMTLDWQGRVWIATAGGGVNIIVPPASSHSSAQPQAISQQHGLPDDNIKAVTEDRDGYIWATTPGHVVKIDPDTFTPTAFHSQFIARNKEFHENAISIGASGVIYTGCSRGLFRFNPRRIALNEYQPPVVISAARVLGEPLITDPPLFEVESLRLSYRSRVVMLSFSALDFSYPTANRYAVKLEGFDEEWSKQDQRYEITYTSLSPGQYTFRVRGTNSDGIWSPHEIALAMTIVPPPWRTTWAYIGYGLLLAGVGGLYVQSRRRKLASLSYLANYDSLTGLPNRVALNRFLATKIEDARNQQQKLSVLFIDFDDFKVINDTMGHHTGDLFLQQAALRLKSCFRDSDFLARFGGDEFVVIIDNVKSPKDVNLTASRVLVSMAEPFSLGEPKQQKVVTVSIGIALYPRDGADTEALLHLADSRMYQAKRDGKNQYRFNDPSPDGPS
jgi:diguanylate cyclase (GGDEF)-like protein